MSVWVAIAILLAYSCSAPITLPWVQQWRSDTFSPVLEHQSLLLQNGKFNLLGAGTNNTTLFLFRPASSSSTFRKSMFAVNPTPTFLIPPSLPGGARFFPPPFELEYGCMDGDRWRRGTISDTPGNWKKKWMDDADLKREMWKMKLKRERRSREIKRRGRGEND
jgi:hypothetical protein